MIKVLKSKLHNLKVTEANLNYIGSITLDVEYLEASGLIPYQEVFIVNVTNGERIETYIIPGERGKGDVCLNGAAARRFAVDDKIIVMGYEYGQAEKYNADYQPKVIIFDYLPSGHLSHFYEHKLSLEQLAKIWNR